MVQGASPGSVWSRAAFFQGRRFEVAGQARTLDEIEHEIIRAVFHDPRVHFALVCGAKGGPLLRGAAYGGASLDATLDDQARRFVSDPTRVRLDRERRVVRLSPIFKWYRKDFEGKDAALLPYLARWLPAADGEALSHGDWKVEFMEYDWSLNGTR